MSPEAIPSVGVTVIGSTGDGFAKETTVATTTGNQPNLIVTVITPVMAICVRFVNLFLTILVGLIAAAMTPAGNDVLGAGDFLTLVQRCVWLSIPGASLGLLKDLITVFGRLEGKYPLLTGNV